MYVSSKQLRRRCVRGPPDVAAQAGNAPAGSVQQLHVCHRLPRCRRGRRRREGRHGGGRRAGATGGRRRPLRAESGAGWIAKLLADTHTLEGGLSALEKIHNVLRRHGTVARLVDEVRVLHGSPRGLALRAGARGSPLAEPVQQGELAVRKGARIRGLDGPKQARSLDGRLRREWEDRFELLLVDLRVASADPSRTPASRIDAAGGVVDRSFDVINNATLPTQHLRQRLLEGAARATALEVEALGGHLLPLLVGFQHVEIRDAHLLALRDGLVRPNEIRVADSDGGRVWAARMVGHGDGRVQHAAAEGVEAVPPANSICLLVVKFDHVAEVAARVGLPAHVRQIDHRQDGGTTGQQPGGTGSARAGRTGALKGQPERIVHAAFGRPHGSHERPLHHQQLPRPHGAGGLQHAARLRPPDLDGPGEVRDVRQQLHRRGRGGGGAAGEVGHAASPPARQAITVDLQKLKVALALPLQPLHSRPQVG
mmetsp:Transcript_145923/g.467772  ORF Transcript_145923/g.467772 Transcript_145923/m.467772 type:complete len:483 (+) Transcript_145923:105-1553(+)